MKVWVIPEDPTYNGYILKPLVERLLKSVGKPNAKVTVLADPYPQGYEMIKAELPAIFYRYQHVNLLLFLPDQDCQDRADEFQALEKKANETGVKFIACAGVEEVEAWLLAGHTDNLPDTWQTIRTDCDLKERYFEPFLEKYGDRSVGNGRQRLMRDTLHNFDGLLARCPELKDLQTRIGKAVATGT